MTTAAMPPGLLALSSRDEESPPNLARASAVLAGVGTTDVVLRTANHSAVELHGIEASLDAAGREIALLCRDPRRHEHDLDVNDVTAILGQRDPAGVLPPFAAATWHADGSEVIVATDRLGFRHIYLKRHPKWSALSTSARALANAGVVDVDRTAVAVQSLLGWQLGTRTMFADVAKVAPGQLVQLNYGEVKEWDTAVEGAGNTRNLQTAVSNAARLLRTYLEAYLDDHPDAVLQLTGGQDSRVLLSAIPETRRHSVEAMTLAVQGSSDAPIAAGIAARFGMVHRVVDLGGLESVSADDAHRMAITAAARMDCAADPLASASIAFAEAKLDQRPRLSGLGGEVTRGFYYLGRPRQSSVTRQRAERLATWRMFTNEAIPRSALEPAFADWARAVTLSEIEQILRSYGTDWLSATDRFYLGERMHRWAGVLATASSMDRAVVNPMLDDRFLAIAGALQPRDKHSSRFLSALSVELDAELARIPMDGRPAPVVYATRSPAGYARLATMTARKITGKLRQRAFGARRPPAGGEVLAAKVAEWYSHHPEALAPVQRLGIFSAEWLERFIAGSVPADVAAVAMLVNLELATSSLADAGQIKRA